MSNCMKRTFPVGLDVEVFSFDALETAYKEAKEEAEKEHVAPYIYGHPEKFNLAFLENGTDCSSFRLTVDTKEDFELIQKIYEKLYPANKMFGFKEMLELFRKEPELKKINEKIHQKKVGEK
jgi:spore coat polysaccharide biosynthesis protein SpsF (cytidylyltransferase family)